MVDRDLSYILGLNPKPKKKFVRFQSKISSDVSSESSSDQYDTLNQNFEVVTSLQNSSAYAQI